MMEGGAAIPVESVAVGPASGRQRRVSPTPSGIRPGGQGEADPALPPALAVAAGPVVPVPGTVRPVPSVPGLAVPVAAVPVPAVPGPVVAAPVVGEVMAFALLPVRPEAPIPAPVLDAPPAPVPAPPLVCAKARPDTVSRKAAAKGRVFEGFFMGGSHIRAEWRLTPCSTETVPRRTAAPGAVAPAHQSSKTRLKTVSTCLKW